ncbi:response regulator transcription factor [Novacetimonas hansenii]|uniref:Response regulator transcription factor n=3 Tax=Novacetimonas hansenii TaxID=436 RepID=A0AAW5EWL2_NOVHA|nr:response regulator transcription factor [Novacetimonas hansenii]EFG82917.1 two component transcriptional regulator, winged helix family protein [Novacetimonas hansenii ATCC 23769]MBL7235228.1 response regulator transcription factor [Novacetimonas hansenii]MCJ8355181.1 response regulator transcription factor [Novacetimonas hansenii]PYD73116.1 DNA-binding response regulator [Novacetimonas hansenii]QOF95818.1 response regulator transcription factor [Novacetimonas hansenii]
MRVLLVEPDKAMMDKEASQLQAVGFMVDHATSGHDAIAMLKLYDYDIAVLELGLPDMEGHDVVRRCRAARIATPILILSAQDSAQAKVKAFSTGADDYVTRPYDPMELTARMQAVIRRSKGYSEPTLQAGALRLSLDSRDVSVNGRSVHLTGKEYMILELLLLRKGMVLTKDAFLNHLYGGMDEPEMKIIDVFICKLRKKLQKAGGENLITTVWGQGYMLKDDAVTTLPMPGAGKGEIAPHVAAQATAHSVGGSVV